MNRDLLERLKNVTEWNAWREKNPEVEIDLEGADLSGFKSLADVDLREACLQGANFEGADLRGSRLEGSVLEGAHLQGANLDSATVTQAYLRGADLSGTNLRGVCVKYAILTEANLCGAEMWWADVRWANLCGANLKGAKLCAPTVLLLAEWGHLSDTTTLALMRLDASAHPNPEAFDRWVEGGRCPYGSDPTFQRVASFAQEKKLWEPGPPPTIYEAVAMVLDEKCPGWRGENRSDGRAVS